MLGTYVLGAPHSSLQRPCHTSKRPACCWAAYARGVSRCGASMLQTLRLSDSCMGTGSTRIGTGRQRPSVLGATADAYPNLDRLPPPR